MRTYKRNEKGLRICSQCNIAQEPNSFYNEKQFTKGMTWEKIGSEIHIDHKIPLASAKTEEDLIHLCHYRNLQPLWKLDNIRKQDKIIPTQIHLAI